MELWQVLEIDHIMQGRVVVFRCWPGPKRHKLWLTLREKLADRIVVEEDSLGGMEDFWKAVERDTGSPPDLANLVRAKRDPIIALAALWFERPEDWEDLHKTLRHVRTKVATVIIQACNPFHLQKTFSRSSICHNTEACNVNGYTPHRSADSHVDADHLLAEVPACCRRVLKNVLLNRPPGRYSDCERELIDSKILTRTENNDLVLADPDWSAAWGDTLEIQ